MCQHLTLTPRNVTNPPQIVSWLSSLARQQQNTQSWPAHRPKGIRGKGQMMLVMKMMLIKRLELSIMLINSDPVDCTSNAIECIAEEVNNKEALPPSCPQDHRHHPLDSHRHSYHACNRTKKYKGSGQKGSPPFCRVIYKITDIVIINLTIKIYLLTGWSWSLYPDKSREDVQKTVSAKSCQ